MTMARVLSVLMWKHAVVRKRRFIHTTVDFVSPLLFFILLFSLKKYVKPDAPEVSNRDPVANTDVLRFNEALVPPLLISYYPDTPLTEALMDEVGPKLNLEKLSSNTDHSLLTHTYFPYSNASQMKDMTSQMGYRKAIVIFEKMTGETLPERLNYTIRMKSRFQTETYETADATPGPHRNFGMDYATFMRIQWAIDTSYIKMLTGNEVPQSLTLQEFPYYHTPKNVETYHISQMLTLICWISLMLTFVFLMCRLLQERTTGIQELMKMVGVSLNTLGLSHFLNVLPAGLIFSIGGTILLKVSSNPIIPNSNGFLIFLWLLLYFNSIVAMAFACSYVSRGTQYAVSLSVLAYVLTWIPAEVLENYTLPYAATLATGLLPHIPMQWFSDELGVLEIYGSGLTFSNMVKANALNNGSALLSYIFLILQATIFYTLAWYLSLVRPGQYGQALPWNFLFKREPKRKRSEKLKKNIDGEYPMSDYETDYGESDYNMSAYYRSKYELRWMTREVDRASDLSTQYYSSEDEDAQYWSKNKNEVKPSGDDDEEEPMAHDPRFFEPPPANAEVGIKIVNVSKTYPKQKALRNVSLEVCKGEITVLVGHNGAGKTTLMSIITGMTSATEGKVYVNGKDTDTQREQVRQNLGLCPQHNLFFPDLTVKEHIMFFTLLKQGTFAEASKSAISLAERLALKDKLHALSRQLSGGMKRRAQLACALAGGASVLVLDEPTSGLDVETRRELWDLLLSLRGERTVLLTTHFMEEADALGDRVAALHAGVLRCYATSMHLKKAVGTGYRLSFTTIGAPKESAITSMVTSHVPNASVKEMTINSISYNLPASASADFPKLFAALESNRSKLGIDSIGVGVSTLEEVFLKLCSDVDTTVTDDEMDNAKNVEPTSKRLTGIHLYLRQFRALMKRQFKYAVHKIWSFLILQIIIPVTVIFVVTNLLNNPAVAPSRSLSMDLDVYADRADRRVLTRLSAPDVSLAAIQNRYPRVTFESADDIAESVLRTAMDNILEYNKYLVGVELNETDAKILYTTTIHHAAPVALNLLSNLLATRYISWADGRTITTMNDPIVSDMPFEIKQPKDMMSTLMWGYFITFIILATNINSVSLPSQERHTGARHIHIMSGCPAGLHWLATLTFHTIICVVALIIPTVIAAATLETDKTINQPELLDTFALILFVGSLSFFAFMYLISFNYGERATSTILVACILIFGILTPIMKTTHDMFESETKGFFYPLLVLCEYVMAPHTMVVAALKCLNVGRINAWCDIMRPYCPAVAINEAGFDSEKCCAGQKPRCYMCIDDYSPALQIYILIGQFIVLMTMVVLTERGFFNGLFGMLMNMRYRPELAPDRDDMVRAEKEYVRKAIDLPPKQISEAMLVDDLHKNYVPLFKRNCNAVKGISFSVKKGECFGLLGVNGAGKSSTFKMLTAEESATRGRIFGNGYHLKRGNPEYLQTLGYCPQFFGLDMFLTGEENLALVLTLRGFDRATVQDEVKSWIGIVGLEKYARRRVEAYSGGCVRRLGAAAALCGRAELALLDEPSAGVDVAARRRLWTALRRALHHQRSVIITSHSMDEMEALCSRIAILSGGRVRALGTAAALRSAHAHGHAVVFKIAQRKHTDEVDGPKTALGQLKGKLHEKFNCTLKDEHKTMLHYHINETMRYSDIFSTLEALRKKFPSLIEDYSVTETTLEEVFLSFAKEQHDNDAKTA